METMVLFESKKARSFHDGRWPPATWIAGQLGFRVRGSGRKTRRGLFSFFSEILAVVRNRFYAITARPEMFG
jgi:hypothetical protein